MRLFFRKYGSGPPLIILHGLFGSSDNWVSFAKNIGHSFTVIVPDQRNHGQSPHNQIHDYSSMSHDLFDLINELQLEKIFLAGHSMGGKTAVNFALNWPERLNGLLVADISPFTRHYGKTEDYFLHREILEFMLTENIAGIKSRHEVKAMLKRKIKSEKVSELILKNLKRETGNSFSWKINASAIHRNFSKVVGGVLPDNGQVSEITGFPVFFLKGEYSEYLPESDFTSILRVFPGAEFLIIPGAGHWIHSDNPEAVKECFLKFTDSF